MLPALLELAIWGRGCQEQGSGVSKASARVAIHELKDTNQQLFIRTQDQLL